MSFDHIPAMIADLLQESRTTNERLASISAGIAAALAHAYQIKAEREAAALPVATVEAPAAVDKPKAEKRAAKVKTEAPAPVAPVDTPTPVAALPEPAPAPATVKPTDAETDRAELVALTAGKPDLRTKALAMIRRDDPAQRFEALPADRRAHILAALRETDDVAA